MGKVIIQPFTTEHPLQLMGYEAGICWGGDVTDPEKNIKRAIDCIQSGHGRVEEFPQVYMTFDGWSARVLREYYTHIGGSPTRLQASTRYINYGDFNYFSPSTVNSNDTAKAEYDRIMEEISKSYKNLIDMGVSKEDVANILPLGMESKMVVRTNLRQLIDMSHQRLCNRAYKEFRVLMAGIKTELAAYSDEWKTVVDMTFKPKCELTHSCIEAHGCGRYPKKEEKE